MSKMANNNLDLMLEKAMKAKAEQIIRIEVKKLERIAKLVVQGYYNSYTPKRPDLYLRSGGLLDSIVSGSVEKVGKRISAEVSFDSRALHNSLFEGNPQGYTPILINNGWVSKKLEARMGVVPHFTRYEGYDLIGKIETRYNAVRHPLANPLKIRGL